MEQNYYAVERSGDSLAHYGVKGMKWGVRKAIDRGNSRNVTRQFIKASKKLAKLENKANIDYQKKRIKNASNKQKVATTLGAMNVGIAGGLTAGSFSDARRLASKGIPAKADIFIPVGAGIAAADIAARQVGKRKAKKLISAEGHKAAVKKANEFRGEMQKAFKGTQYAKNIGGMAKDIAAKKRSRVEKNVAKFEKSDRLNRIANMYSVNSTKKTKKRNKSRG